jgi:hypothetical protein
MRDARLLQALKHAPDAQAAPRDDTREAILHFARGELVQNSTVAETTSTSTLLEHAALKWQVFFERLSGIGKPGAPWNAAIATVLVMGAIGMMWRGYGPEHLPEEQTPAATSAPITAPITAPAPAPAPATAAPDLAMAKKPPRASPPLPVHKSLEARDKMKDLASAPPEIGDDRELPKTASNQAAKEQSAPAPSQAPVAASMARAQLRAAPSPKAEMAEAQALSASASMQLWAHLGRYSAALPLSAEPPASPPLFQQTYQLERDSRYDNKPEPVGGETARLRLSIYRDRLLIQEGRHAERSVALSDNEREALQKFLAQLR